MDYKIQNIIEKWALIWEKTQIWNYTHIRSWSCIGTWCNIWNNVYIDSNVIIWNNVKIQNGVNIYNWVSIWDDVFVWPGVTFTNDLFPRAFIWDDSKLTKTQVRKGASIGANATIKCWITIWEYAMIGAGAMVTKDVPDYWLVIWNPGRLVGSVTKNWEKITN